MSSSLILSAMAVVALTATTLTTLKYYPAHESDADDLNLIEDDYGDDANATFYYHHSPKFPYKNVNRQNDLPIFTDKPHVVVKRSSDEESTVVQYSIDDKNSSMIDEAKRDKVKEVSRLNNVYTSVAAAITCQNHINTPVLFFIVSL